MDATAQAELVSSGQASPAELVDAAIERVEQVNPEINAVIHDLSESAREEAAGELPDGPFKGVPFLLKDLGAANAGQPLHLGMNVLKEANFHAPVDTTLAAALPRRRPRHDRQDEHPGARDRPDDRAGGLRGDAQPLGHDAHPRRLERRLGAAVAAGIVPMAHANDGGGSIRIPASTTASSGSSRRASGSARGR